MGVSSLLSLFSESECLQFFKHLCQTALIRTGIWYPWWYEPPPSKLEDYKIIGQVRDTAFNKVYRCCRRDNDRILVAIKEIAIPDDDPIQQFPQSMSWKVSFHRLLPHPNVAKMLYTITTEKFLYLVYECFSDDLSSIIELPKDLRVPLIKVGRSFGDVLRMFHQILSGVAHYHNFEILVGDIKPKHLQMTLNMKIKLADFGFAGSTGDPWRTYYPIKSSQYSAPELLLGSRRHSKAADMWSVGCIFGEMITGKPLFQAKTHKDQLNLIFRLLGTPTEESWPQITEICSRRTLLLFPKFEPMNLAVKFFGFEPEGIDLLSKMLCLDPRRRISAANALKHDYFKDVNQRESSVIQRTPPRRILNTAKSTGSSRSQPPKRSSY